MILRSTRGVETPTFGFHGESETHRRTLAASYPEREGALWKGCAGSEKKIPHQDERV